MGFSVEGKIAFAKKFPFLPHFELHAHLDYVDEYRDRFWDVANDVINIYAVPEALNLSPAQADLFGSWFAHYYARKTNANTARILRAPISPIALKFPPIRACFSLLTKMYEDQEFVAEEFKDDALRQTAIMSGDPNMIYETFIQLTDADIYDDDDPEQLMVPVGKPEGIRSSANALSTIYSQTDPDKILVVRQMHEYLNDHS